MLELFSAPPFCHYRSYGISFFHFAFHCRCFCSVCKVQLFIFLFVEDLFSQIDVQIGSRAKSVSHSCVQNAPRFAALQFLTHFSLMRAKCFLQNCSMCRCRDTMSSFLATGPTFGSFGSGCRKIWSKKSEEKVFV